MPIDLEDETQRSLLKEVLGQAIDTWLDKQFTKLGRWSFGGIASVLVAAVAYLYLSTHGLKV